MVGIEPPEDRIIKDLIKTNRRTEGQSLTMEEYREHGEYNPRQASNRFGSWNEARATAGIYKERTKKISENKLLKDLADADKKVQGRLTVEKYREHGEYSVNTIYNRFNSFSSARKKAT